jgi:hypothetical protein
MLPKHLKKLHTKYMYKNNFLVIIKDLIGKYLLRSEPEAFVFPFPVYEQGKVIHTPGQMYFTFTMSDGQNNRVLGHAADLMVRARTP